MRAYQFQAKILLVFLAETIAGKENKEENTREVADIIKMYLFLAIGMWYIVTNFPVFGGRPKSSNFL